MRTLIFPLLTVVSVQACQAQSPGDRYLRAMNGLADAKGEASRFYALGDAAKESFQTGHVEDARTFAMALLEMSSRFKKDWNYGNAIQDGNLVLGRIAVKEGRMDEAKRCLLAAGRSPGSPQMDTFGPNMSLAKDLLEKGERDTVLEYFELCRRFWDMHDGRLDAWSALVKEKHMPDFGPNLLY